jgi:hypothetical protein
MNKFQKLKFKSIEEHLAYLPKDERHMVQELLELVLNIVPHATEKISFNVPFYHGPKWFCLIWPATIPWGNIKKGVSMGFINAHKINDPFGFLEFDKRKYTGRVILQSVKDIKEKEEALRYYIMEAWEINNPVK